ncbi:dynein axonemal assembly factor 8 isoform X2 [Erpetoichthys calabaricus]|uniref:dynein axonemal assembly factor 8 isoform X2 n=1 Tax=Erpetoichthys calabaricus TaxID=27687 RepID=UPI0022341F78|nr:dynein axonemal assembly factor 8 isoform X2 [Erpetoichthys calabaricus]
MATKDWHLLGDSALSGVQLQEQRSGQPNWESIFTNIDTRVPSLDSDSSLSDYEESDVQVFHRKPATLITGPMKSPPLLEVIDTVDILDVPKTPEITGKTKDLNQEEILTLNGPHLQDLLNSEQPLADMMAELSGTSAQSLQIHMDKAPACNEISRGSVDLSPWGTAGNVSFTPEGSQDGSGDPCRNIEEDFSSLAQTSYDRCDVLEGKEEHPGPDKVSSSAATEGKDSVIQSESERRCKSKESDQNNGLPVLSLQLLDKWDLDEVLHALKEKAHSSCDATPSPVLPEDPGHSGECAHGDLMEKLTDFCRKQSGGQMELDEDLITTRGLFPSLLTEEHAVLRDRLSLKSPFSETEQIKGEKLSQPKKNRRPTVYVDLRNAKPTGRFSRTEPKEYLAIREVKAESRCSVSSSSDEEESSDIHAAQTILLTGKSILLQKLKEANKENAANALNFSQKKPFCDPKKPKEGLILPSSKRRKKCSRSEMGTTNDLTCPRPMAEDKKHVNGAAEEKLPKKEPPGRDPALNDDTRSSAVINGIMDSTNLRQKENAKRQAHRQRLHSHLESLKPKRSVCGRQAAAQTTELLYDPEASFSPFIHTLPPDIGSRETLLLTIRLSNPGQAAAIGQTTASSLDSVLMGCNVYNALLTWLLSLNETPSWGQAKSADVDQVAPFWVAGIQQLWREEGLALYVCAASHEGGHRQGQHRGRPARHREEEKASSLFYQRVSKFLSKTSLCSVIPWAEELKWHLAKQAHFIGVDLPAARLSSFIAINPDKKAVGSVFDVPVGFYWQTIETEEEICVTSGEAEDRQHLEMEVAMTLASKAFFREPLATHHTLQLMLMSSLDMCGLRLLYPPHEPFLSSAGKLCTNLDQQERPQPVLALAFRGPRAISVWQDIAGPSDSVLAGMTDPNSINAMYCPPDQAFFYSPRLGSHIQSELCTWFGGRVPEDGIIKVGLQNDKRLPVSRSDVHSMESTARPPAALIAITEADIFLVVSPIIPALCFGDVLLACSRCGFRLRGVKRVPLSTKRAQALGISSHKMSAFCTAPSYTGSSEDEPRMKLTAHCLFILLRRENALHHSASLITGLMNEFSEQGLLATVCRRFSFEAGLEPGLCFHTLPYNEVILRTLGGTLWAVPDCGSVLMDMLSVRTFSSKPELEQVVILTLTGQNISRPGNFFLRKILRGDSPLEALEGGGFELLGLKWLPTLSLPLARELTPFEVGDKQWQDSVARLASSSALVVALRRVNGFAVLRELLQDSSNGLEKLMSPTPELAFRQAALFFTEQELLSDDFARPLLKFLPPANKLGCCLAKRNRVLQAESIFKYMVNSAEMLYTVMFLKPTVWFRSLGKILCKVEHEGFHLVGLKVHRLDQQSALALLTPAQLQNPSFVESQVEYLTSAPSLILCLQRENAVKRLLDLLGPEDPLQARKDDQFLWRAQYGTDLLHNGIYGSPSYSKAVKDVKLFFSEGICCKETLLMEQEEIRCAASDLLIKTEHLCSCSPAKKHIIATMEASPARNALCQTTCLLISTCILCTPQPSLHIQLLQQLFLKGFSLVGGRLCHLDRAQGQLVAGVLRSFQEQFAVTAMLSKSPCLILALQRENAVTCFDSILDSICWEKPELERIRQSLLFPQNETQANKLLCCLFESCCSTGNSTHSGPWTPA